MAGGVFAGTEPSALTLALVRNIGSASVLRTAEDVAAVEQEITDQYALVIAAAGDRPLPGRDIHTLTRCVVETADRRVQQAA